jgi:hypothetical protein
MPLNYLLLKKKAIKPHNKMWQGYLDSNQGMAASKAAALPLGDSPTMFVQSPVYLKQST